MGEQGPPLAPYAASQPQLNEIEECDDPPPPPPEHQQRQQQQQQQHVDVKRLRSRASSEAVFEDAQSFQSAEEEEEKPKPRRRCGWLLQPGPWEAVVVLAAAAAAAALVLGVLTPAYVLWPCWLLLAAALLLFSLSSRAAEPTPLAVASTLLPLLALSALAWFVPTVWELALTLVCAGAVALQPCCCGRWQRLRAFGASQRAARAALFERFWDRRWAAFLPRLFAVGAVVNGLPLVGSFIAFIMRMRTYFLISASFACLAVGSAAASFSPAWADATPKGRPRKIGRWRRVMQWVLLAAGAVPSALLLLAWLSDDQGETLYRKASAAHCAPRCTERFGEAIIVQSFMGFAGAAYAAANLLWAAVCDETDYYSDDGEGAAEGAAQGAAGAQAVAPQQGS